MSYTLDEARREAVRQSERRLEAQQSMAASADQRAIAFCAVVVVIVAILLDDLSASQHTLADWLVIWFLTAAGTLAIFSASPVRFYGVGGSVSGFRNYLTEQDCDKMLEAIGKRNDDYIKENDKRIKRSTWAFRFALTFAFIGIFIMYFNAYGLKHAEAKMSGALM
jgi:hypothetical protein